jgi:hypothetical protein
MECFPCRVGSCSNAGGDCEVTEGPLATKCAAAGPLDEQIQYVREHNQLFLYLCVCLSIAITCRIECLRHYARARLQSAGLSSKLGGVIMWKINLALAAMLPADCTLQQQPYIDADRRSPPRAR